MAHTEDEEASTVTVTARPEVAEAVGEYVAPPTTAFVGAVEVKLTVWAALPTVKVCWTCGAAV